MNAITFPLRRDNQGPAVADLQDALQLCLDRGVILANDETARRRMSAALTRERAEQTYGDTTALLVRTFQTEQGLQRRPSGEVDEPTATALNTLLQEWGVLNPPPEPPPPQERLFVVSGQVRYENNEPLSGVRVRAVHEAEQGAILLGETTTDTDGRYTISYDPRLGGDSINLRVIALDARGQSLYESEVRRGAQLRERVDLIVPITPSLSFVVSGQVRQVQGAYTVLLPGVRVRAVHEAEQGAIPLGEAITDAEGRYTIHYDPLPGGASINLRVTVWDARGQLVCQSEVIRGAQLRERVDLIVPITPSLSFVVSGQVRRADNVPLQDVQVRAVHEAERGAIPLGEATTDAEGRYIIRYNPLPGGASINLRVTVWDARGNLLCESEVIYGAQLRESVNLIVPSTRLYQVEGKVASRASAGVGGLLVVIVDKGVGGSGGGGDEEQGDVQLANAITDDDGAYQVPPFSDSKVRQRGKAQPDLQARVFTDAKGAFLGASDVRYNASQHETLNVLLDDKAAAALRSEHEVLTSALARQFRGKLRDLKETDAQQDITYLANKTGWDARAVALAALADQSSARTDDIEGGGIEPVFFYALFRAGLPTNDATLYQINAKTAEAIWQQAIKQGVISSKLEDRLPRAVEQFQKLAARRVLDGPPLVGVSSLGDMLSVSFPADPQHPEQHRAHHQQFANLYIQYRDNLPQFWEQVQATFGEPVMPRLKLDGQLASLTLNNAPLIRKLRDAAAREQRDLTDMLHLVEQGYYRAETWQDLMGNDDPIPPEIPGRKAYAEFLAAQLRLSFPTAVVAQMVRSRMTPVSDGLVASVHGFLMAHHREFEIGRQPIEQYVKQRNLQAQDITPAVVREITRIQRVLQITPSDEAMNALLQKGIDSSYAVVRYARDEFVRIFKDEVGGEAHARLIYAQSQQVHNAVLNLVVSYLTASSAPGIGVHSPGQIVNPAPRGPDPQAVNAGDVLAYPTLEGLFGEMDYCACEHCRSILSPAAYLVDLLQFIDLKRYNSQGVESPKTYEQENPLDVLLSRRPDLQHLPLTCENTNTSLPYIDLVNETLEYYVTNKSLENYTGHNTNGAATSEALLANPQFVSDKAYETLAGQPARAGDPPPLLPPTPPLPFHQPLENLRRYFDTFQAPLPKVMESLRKDDSPERANESEYGWRDIWIEELRLSRVEHSLLTQCVSNNDNNDNTDVWLTLKRLYGYTPDPGQLDMAGISNAKGFTRRVGITYQELLDLISTQFINPHSHLLPKLEKLGYRQLIPKLEKLALSFKTIHDLYSGRLTDAQFEALLPAGLDKNQYDGGNVKAWVLNNYDQIMQNLGVTFQTIKDFKEGRLAKPAFRKLVPIHELDITQFGGRVEQSDEEKYAQIEQWLQDNYDQIMGIILLMDPTRSGDISSFDKLEFRYADPDKLNMPMSAYDFIRMIRLIRLWKKMGWTIEQTDKAIAALYPMNQTPNDPDDAVKLQKLDKGFLTLLPRMGVVKRVMEALKLHPQKDLLPLLVCFAPMNTHGATSLYRQMFLSPTFLKQHPVFADNGYGQFLTDTTQHLTAHAEALRAAFLLTDDELHQITAALGYDANTPLGHAPTDQELTQLLGHAPSVVEKSRLTEHLRTEKISAVFRRGWLARKLKLSVREFLLLTQYTDLDPFAAPDPPNPPILRLIQLAHRLQAASLKPTQALYLMWNQDISGKSAPDDNAIAEFARTLRADFAAIESEFVLLDDPDGQIARTRMAQVYGNDATDLFFSLLGNTLVTSVPYSHAQVNLLTKVPYTHPAAVLEQPIVDAGLGRIAYAPAQKELSFNGTLTPGIRDALKAVAGITEEFKAAVDSLYAENQKVIQANVEQPIADTGLGRIAYDDFRKQLSFAGVLTKDTKTALKDVAATTLSPQKAVDTFQEAVEALYAENHTHIIEPFFTRYPELRSLYEAYDFFGQLSSSIDDYQHAQATLENSILDIAQGRLTYDPNRWQLSWSGVLSATRCKALQDVQGMSQPFKTAMEALHTKNQDALQQFFANHPTLAAQKDAYVAADNAPEKMRSVLLQNFLPQLKDRRKRQQALQAISAVAKADIAFASALLDDVDGASVLHAAADTAHAAVDDLTALEKPGLSAQFFSRNTATEPIDRTSNTEATLDYAAGSNTTLPDPAPASAISGIWSGYLEAPENGLYNLQITTDAGAKVKLTLNGKTRDDVQRQPNSNVWSNTQPIALRAGTLNSITLTVENVKDKLAVRWETQGRGWEIIPARYLYSTTLTDHLRQVYVRFLKVASLAAALKLTTTEIAYLAAHAEYQGSGQNGLNINGQSWLNSLPGTGSPNTATSIALLKAFNAMMDFARLKADLAPNDERLLTVLTDPGAATQKPDSLLFTLTRWESSSLDALLTRFGKVNGGNADRHALQDLHTLCRVYDAYTWVKKLNISSSALLQAATNEPNPATVRALQSALRARYDESDWLNVLKPINDEMRGLQRNALVAYILHQMRSALATAHIDTPDKLFEYFLMDVQMEPCMQTSRIRHALSSVQLFIERCLMNLEPRVAPSAINAKQWEWMKRYRVWEANRKVFLYPENWLEPELRDDQSPFFKETMSELLQSDITEDSAATALLNYLSKLEAVAKLEPCGIHYIEDDPTTKAQDDIAHVVARTAGANRKYYYRRYEHGYWTPWEQIKLDIEDNPVIPVVWKGRLLLLWLRILKKPIDLDKLTESEEGGDSLASLSPGKLTNKAREDAAKNLKMTVQAVLCWSEYYNGKWQPTKTSDVNDPNTLGDYPSTGEKDFNRSDLRLWVSEESGKLRVAFGDSTNKSSSFLLYNTHSLPQNAGPFPGKTRINKSKSPLTVSYNESEYEVLKSQIAHTAIEPRHTLLPWNAPFFYEGRQHVFYVTTSGHIPPVDKQPRYGPPLPKPEPKIIPPFKTPPPPVHKRPDVLDQFAMSPFVGNADAAAIDLFLLEKTQVNKVIASPGAVRFGDKEIGPAGSLISPLKNP